MNEARGPWYLLTGLLLGAALGLFLSLAVFPVRLSDIAPASLDDGGREQQRALIALSFLADGDLGRARARLALLQEENPIGLLAAQAQRAVAQGASPDEARALARLAAALQGQTPEPAGPLQTLAAAGPSPTAPSQTPAPSETPAQSGDLTAAPGASTPRPTRTPTPETTFTPRPTATQPPALSAPFSLKEKTRVCDPDLPPLLLQVEVLDETGKPAPGVRVFVSWEDGQDAFSTGLHPAYSPGYGDFSMQEGAVYSVRVGEAGEPVSGLRAETCKNKDGSTFPGGWWLTFTR